MRPLALALLALLLAACGSRTGDVADDPGSEPVPRGIPAAPGQVSSRGAVTVLDDGGGPEACLGPVAESFPPQCGGPPLAGWDWKGQLPDSYQQAAGVVWGEYSVTGRWDGETLSVTGAVPAAQAQPPVDDPGPAPPPADPTDQATLERIVRELGRELPGAQASYVADGRAHVDVVYDDGSLQDWTDRTHGTGTVVVTPMLVDVPESELG